MKASLVIAVLNEENSILPLLESIFQQTQKPAEVIIVDGGSRDNTVTNLKSQISNLKYFREKLKLRIKKGNRAIGRNYGIKLAKNEIIALTDAGCVLDKNWLKEITAPFKDPTVEVVSGYYKPQEGSIFEWCVAAYALVMPDKINPAEFLPAARSMAIRKKTWQETGGFPENFSLNEDYVFARRLKKHGVKFFFSKEAIVYWQPPKTLKKTYQMFFNFARGDAQARIFRPKVGLIFLRYLLGTVFLIGGFLKSDIILNTLYLLLVFYIFWAISKNYKYVKNWRAIIYLSLLQFTSDLAVIFGTILGSFKLYLPRAVLTNTFYQSIGKFITTFLGILTTILLTRYLGVLGFGQFNLILTYFAFAGTFADFGLGLLLTREIARNSSKKEYLDALFTLRLFLTLFTLSIFVILAFFLPYPKQVLTGIIIYAFGNFFTLLYNMYFAVFQARLHLEKHLISQSLGALAVLFLTFLFVVLKFTFGWFIFAQVIGALTTFLTGWKLLDLKLSLNINFPAFKKIFKDGWPLSLGGIIAVIYSRVDIFILSFFRNPGNLPDVGIYSLAYRIFEVVLIFSTFFSNALFPIFIKEIKNDNFKKILNQSLVMSLGGGLLVTIGVIIFARQIILLVAGERFILATLPLQILSLTFILSLFLNIFYNLVVTLNKQKFLILVGMVALGFNLFANVIFIPRFSYLASSVITVLTAAIILCGYILIYAFSRRSY